MSERPSPRRPVKVTLLGPSGDGRSQFATMLLGKLVFVVSDGPNSQTEISDGLDFKVGNIPIRVIDQPGFGSLSQDIQKYLNTITSSLQQEQYLNAICLCISANRNKVGDDIQTTLRNVHNMWATPDIYKHLCLVITHTDTPQKKTTFLNNMLPAINVEIDKLFGNSEKTIPKLPIFFVDSAINPDSRTLAEKNRFLAHVMTLSAISTSNINRLDANYKLVTEEIVDEPSPGQPQPFMVTIIRNGLQMDPECGEPMTVTIHQNVKRLRLELSRPDRFGGLISYRTLGPVGEPWPTVDDSKVRVFKKVFTTRRTILGATEQMQENFDRNGTCIEISPWKQIKDPSASLTFAVILALGIILILIITVVRR
ncbi:hypothetical protein BLNAU_19146 [Blattamonas nauphoetae]|uniref:AIG1-type G domain-containing protein n=1 Tax=Blattamonas nauphoetae TaxID=2049346 RepID=A0ABQ9X2C6_9EUKA|nr:hypothetical protein BLNAU_19146 [Blattamonas nauphoetae]